jgi:hypothetical protein
LPVRENGAFGSWAKTEEKGKAWSVSETMGQNNWEKIPNMKKEGKK